MKEYFKNYQAKDNNSLIEKEREKLFKSIPNFTIDKARSSFLKISFYYGDLSYTSIDESPIWNFPDLLASVGGQLGLFIGKLI